jgi:hypothetical protein
LSRPAGTDDACPPVIRPGIDTHTPVVAEHPENNTFQNTRRSTMAATLKLTHKAIGVEVRRGTYEIVVDGQRAGSLEMNETIEIPVEPDVTLYKFAMAETPAELIPSTPPRARP